MKVYFLFKNELEKRKLWTLFIYLFFGGLTTVVNFMVYFFCKDLLEQNYLVANVISWVAAVLFAFVTNKLWVFQSKTTHSLELVTEFLRFMFYRILSLFLDMGMMYILISLIQTNDLVAKLITQIAVVLANYLFSKLFIFNQSNS
ncbi:MAG: GtrA family protein [Enterococcus sp.]